MPWFDFLFQRSVDMDSASRIEKLIEGVFFDGCMHASYNGGYINKNGGEMGALADAKKYSRKTVDDAIRMALEE